MTGFRKAIVAAALVCCTFSVASEPKTSHQLGSFLQGGWAKSGDIELNAEAGSSSVASPIVHSVPPVMQGPVNRNPLSETQTDQTFENSKSDAASQKPSQDGKSSDREAAIHFRDSTSTSTNTLHPDFLGGSKSARDAIVNGSKNASQTEHVSDSERFDDLQIESAPSVNRLQRHRSRNNINTRHAGNEKSRSRVVSADPIPADGLPCLVELEGPDATIEEDDQPTLEDVCDLVAADAIDPAEKSTFELPDASNDPNALAGETANHATQGQPDFTAVALLFRDFQARSVQDEPMTDSEQPQVQSHAGPRSPTEDLVFPATSQASSRTSEDPIAAFGDSPGLIEGGKTVSVDPLQRAAELWELTQLSLQQAKQTAENGNMAASGEAAMNAFRLCVTALDAAEQTDNCKNSFQTALAAMRESYDFCNGADSMSSQQIRQAISGHSTAVLKGGPLDGISAHKAAFCYMTHARMELVKASKGIPEASKALMMLGTAESESTDGDPAFSNAIAVMLLRAAIEVCPEDYEPHFALGMVLSKQGLVSQARLSLQHSFEIRPTRRGYESLNSLAKHTEEGLSTEHGQLQSDSATVRIDTNTPSNEGNHTVANANQDALPNSAGAAESDVKPDRRIGWKNLLQLVR